MCRGFVVTKTPEIIFAPGCFDNFDGTQEELDEMIAVFKAMVEDGTVMDNLEELTEEETDFYLNKIGNTLQ